MTHDDDPRALWTPALLQVRVLPWEMALFTPRELTAIAEWAKE